MLLRSVFFKFSFVEFSYRRTDLAAKFGSLASTNVLC